MEPMMPMKPMDGGDAWWPENLGKPSSSGSQDGMRYAFFPDKKRLVVETDGKTKTYDSGDHQISGVQQANGGQATFSDKDGTVELSDLKAVD
ncbi:hypothetical protein [Lichenibacterium dinghuense]|uniref:hypothetical protein n=1 Tax=Lichenibacterium dinghuense TaxID=2895977 RepID=UPI001F4862D0|nr:hypothetical protein [Lichenibacterium sp. 6Y81]